jgi:hypothetical protein
MDATELKALLADLNEPFSTSQVKALLKSIDKDNSGTIGEMTPLPEGIHHAIRPAHVSCLGRIRGVLLGNG